MNTTTPRNTLLPGTNSQLPGRYYGPNRLLPLRQNTVSVRTTQTQSISSPLQTVAQELSITSPVSPSSEAFTTTVMSIPQRLGTRDPHTMVSPSQLQQPSSESSETILSTTDDNDVLNVHDSVTRNAVDSIPSLSSPFTSSSINQPFASYSLGRSLSPRNAQWQWQRNLLSSSSSFWQRTTPTSIPLGTGKNTPSLRPHLSFSPSYSTLSTTPSAKSSFSSTFVSSSSSSPPISNSSSSHSNNTPIINDNIHTSMDSISLIITRRSTSSPNNYSTEPGKPRESKDVRPEAWLPVKQDKPRPLTTIKKSMDDDDKNMVVDTTLSNHIPVLNRSLSSPFATDPNKLPGNNTQDTQLVSLNSPFPAVSEGGRIDVDHISSVSTADKVFSPTGSNDHHHPHHAVESEAVPKRRNLSSVHTSSLESLPLMLPSSSMTTTTVDIPQNINALSTHDKPRKPHRPSSSLPEFSSRSSPVTIVAAKNVTYEPNDLFKPFPSSFSSVPAVSTVESKESLPVNLENGSVPQVLLSSSLPALAHDDSFMNNIHAPHRLGSNKHQNMRAEIEIKVIQSPENTQLDRSVQNAPKISVPDTPVPDTVSLLPVSLKRNNSKDALSFLSQSLPNSISNERNLPVEIMREPVSIDTLNKPIIDPTESMNQPSLPLHSEITHTVETKTTPSLSFTSVKQVLPTDNTELAKSFTPAAPFDTAPSSKKKKEEESAVPISNSLPFFSTSVPIITPSSVLQPLPSIGSLLPIIHSRHSSRQPSPVPTNCNSNKSTSHPSTRRSSINNESISIPTVPIPSSPLPSVVPLILTSFPSKKLPPKPSRNPLAMERWKKIKDIVSDVAAAAKIGFIFGATEDTTDNSTTTSTSNNDNISNTTFPTVSSAVVIIDNSLPLPNESLSVPLSDVTVSTVVPSSSSEDTDNAKPYSSASIIVPDSSFSLSSDDHSDAYLPKDSTIDDYANESFCSINEPSEGDGNRMEIYKDLNDETSFMMQSRVNTTEIVVSPPKENPSKVGNKTDEISNDFIFPIGFVRGNYVSPLKRSQNNEGTNQEVSSATSILTSPKDPPNGFILHFPLYATNDDDDDDDDDDGKSINAKDTKDISKIVEFHIPQSSDQEIAHDIETTDTPSGNETDTSNRQNAATTTDKGTEYRSSNASSTDNESSIVSTAEHCSESAPPQSEIAVTSSLSEQSSVLTNKLLPSIEKLSNLGVIETVLPLFKNEAKFLPESIPSSSATSLPTTNDSVSVTVELISTPEQRIESVKSESSSTSVAPVRSRSRSSIVKGTGMKYSDNTDANVPRTNVETTSNPVEPSSGKKEGFVIVEMDEEDAWGDDMWLPNDDSEEN